MNKNDILVALQCSVNTSFPLKKDAIGFDGMIENYSMYVKSKCVTVEINNLKYQYGVCANGDGNLLVIAFRGSNNDQDWRYNFEFAQKEMVFDDMPYGYKSRTGVAIHTGFRKDYAQCEAGIHEMVKAFADGEVVKNILIVGHSLGGALAHIASLDMQFNFGDRMSISCVSFGSPRVFNHAGVASYNRRVPNTVRVVNGSDPVPRVPFAEMGYEHVGNEMHVNADGLWKFSPFNWMPGLSIAAVWDHCPNLYYKGIQRFSDDELRVLQGV